MFIFIHLLNYPLDLQIFETLLVRDRDKVLDFGEYQDESQNRDLQNIVS